MTVRLAGENAILAMVTVLATGDSLLAPFGGVGVAVPGVAGVGLVVSDGGVVGVVLALG